MALANQPSASPTGRDSSLDPVASDAEQESLERERVRAIELMRSEGPYVESLSRLSSIDAIGEFASASISLRTKTFIKTSQPSRSPSPSPIPPSPEQSRDEREPTPPEPHSEIPPVESMVLLRRWLIAALVMALVTAIALMLITSRL